MPTNQGVAIAWGDPVDGCSAVGTINNSQGTSFKYEADTHELKDAVGGLIGKYWYNYRKTLSLSCFNYNTTSMNATPHPGAQCSVTTNGDDSEMADTTYIVESCTKERAPDAAGKFTVELVAYDSITPS